MRCLSHWGCSNCWPWARSQWMLPTSLRWCLLCWAWAWAGAQRTEHPPSEHHDHPVPACISFRDIKTQSVSHSPFNTCSSCQLQSASHEVVNSITKHSISLYHDERQNRCRLAASYILHLFKYYALASNCEPPPEPPVRSHNFGASSQPRLDKMKRYANHGQKTTKSCYFVQILSTKTILNHERPLIKNISNQRYIAQIIG